MKSVLHSEKRSSGGDTVSMNGKSEVKGIEYKNSICALSQSLMETKCFELRETAE